MCNRNKKVMMTINPKNNNLYEFYINSKSDMSFEEFVKDNKRDEVRKFVDNIKDKNKGGDIEKQNDLKEFLDILNMASIDDDDTNATNGPNFGPNSSSSTNFNSSTSKSKTPVLDSFSRDLSKMADEGKLEPVIGREKEINRIIQILSRKKKNNPILIGEPGSGKTSIADGLAIRISNREVPIHLHKKRIVSLDLGSMVAGTKYRGQFEERIKGVISEIEKSPEVILFIDEFHTIIGAGGASGSLDASNMIKPALSRGEIQCIAATTVNEYRQHIEKDGALSRRFQKVDIEPTSVTDTIAILNQVKGIYERAHNVSYTDEAIEACVTLTNRYINDRQLPDKAFDALDETGAMIQSVYQGIPDSLRDMDEEIRKMDAQKDALVKSQKYEEAASIRDIAKRLREERDKSEAEWIESSLKRDTKLITADDVAATVSAMCGIPLTKVTGDENRKMLSMEKILLDNIIGQDDAIKSVVKAIQRGRVGFKKVNKPVFSGLLIGNSGVGKTELAKQITKYMFDSENAMIRIDMSEYMEKFSISRIIGAPSGYVGYDDTNVLDVIRRKPHSVILLDEIEKAHPDVQTLFLQALDDGHMTDTQGRKVSFKNCVILMTSNVGTKQLKEFGTGMGFESNTDVLNREKNVKGILMKELKKAFRPEFINRIDDIIYFKDLDKKDIRKIIILELRKGDEMANAMGYELVVTDKMIDYILETGYDKDMGARPVERKVTELVYDAITERLVEQNDIPVNSTITVDYDGEKTVIDVKPSGKIIIKDV